MVTRTGRNRLLIELRGQLEVSSAEQLERRLFLPRRANIDLDLGELAFIDTAGMRFLVMVGQKRGGKVEVVACSPAAARALELAGLSRLIQRPSGGSRRAR
jgi:anti-anti-sigma factor